MWSDLEDLEIKALVKWRRKRLHRCDPYLVWADATTEPQASKNLDIFVLVELFDKNDFWCFFARMNLDVRQRGLNFLPNGMEGWNKSCFVTGVVNQTGLRRLVASVLKKHIARFSLQESRADLADTMPLNFCAADCLGAGEEESEVELIRRDGTYLAIIDDGLPLLAIRDFIQFVKKPVRLWDQGWVGRVVQGEDPSNPTSKPPAKYDRYWTEPWDVNRGFLYGRRSKPWPIALLAPPELREGEYFAARYFFPAPRSTHGARVLGLMAPWLSGLKHEVQWPAYISGLAMVQLPTRTVRDSAGGSLAMRVLDGLRFILWQEEKDRPDPECARPLVTNISYGVHAGPHDGTSMLERALKEALDRHTNLHVVLPAGNGHRAGCHLRQELQLKGSVGDAANMMLRVLPDNAGDTFVEIWIPKLAEISLSIRMPGTDVAVPVVQGDAKFHYEPMDSGQPKRPKVLHFAAIYAEKVAQGTEGTMILLAIGPTQARRMADGVTTRGLHGGRRRHVMARPGLWQLEVRNLSGHKIDVDAWIERADAPPDQQGSSRQAFFPDSCARGMAVGNATPAGTLNGIATFEHDRAHVVGAMRLDGRLSDYSAAGKGRTPVQKEIDVVAPADWSNSIAGLHTMGFSSGSVCRINGTSAASAVYARALAEHLDKQPNTLPQAPTPADLPPEIDCAPERQPIADPKLRGQQWRMLFPYEIDR